MGKRHAILDNPIQVWGPDFLVAQCCDRVKRLIVGKHEENVGRLGLLFSRLQLC